MDQLLADILHVKFTTSMSALHSEELVAIFNLWWHIKRSVSWASASVVHLLVKLHSHSKDERERASMRVIS